MKRWYVVQVYTGYEDVVKADLEQRIQAGALSELFGKVLVPKGEVVRILDGADMSKEKIFPGYLLIQMEMVSEAFRLVSQLPRVTRFLGGESPMALTDAEVGRIFNQMEGGLPATQDKTLYTLGSEVHITNGPFSGFTGIIDSLDEEHDRVTVMVSIFGRMTPVELNCDQIKK